MAGIEDIVVESFGNQILDSSRQQVRNDTEQFVQVVLAQCMQDLADIVTEEEQNLETLRNQWLEVQADIVGLAVEILGKQTIEFEPHGLSDATEKKIDDANLKNKETEKRYEEADQSINIFEVDVDALHIDTTKMVKAQQKVNVVPCFDINGTLTALLADLESGAKEDAGQHQASHGDFREEQMKGATFQRVFETSRHFVGEFYHSIYCRSHHFFGGYARAGESRTT